MTCILCRRWLSRIFSTVFLLPQGAVDLLNFGFLILLKNSVVEMPVFTLEEYFLHFRNDNLHMDGSKEIWNSNKSNLNKVSQSFIDYFITLLFPSNLAIIGVHRTNCS